MMFSLLVALASVIAGAVAAISGFDIGSLLTPLLAVRYGTKLAVAIVSVPHLVTTAARFFRLRKHLDRKVFLNFGILSAISGLLGALLNAREQPGADHCVRLFAHLRGDLWLDRVCGSNALRPSDGLGCRSVIWILWWLGWQSRRHSLSRPSWL